MENLNLYLGELVGTAFFYGIRIGRVRQYFLKKIWNVW